MVSAVHATNFPEIKDWKINSEVLSFQKENLWEHINGAADQYIDYDFIELTTGELKQDSIVVSVEIYQMRTPLAAYGIFSLERPAQGTRFSIGGQAMIIPPGQLLMFKDIYYVKVFVYEGVIDELKGKKLLTALSAELPGNEGMPSALAFLPVENRMYGSEGYILKDYLGLPELHSCIYANYMDSLGTEYVVFCVIDDTHQSANEYWDRLKDRGWSEAEIKGDLYLYRQIPYRGKIVLFTHKGNIFGIAYRDNLEDFTRIRSRLFSQK